MWMLGLSDLFLAQSSTLRVLCFNNPEQPLLVPEKINVFKIIQLLWSVADVCGCSCQFVRHLASQFFNKGSCRDVAIFKISAASVVKTTLQLIGFTVLPKIEILSMFIVILEYEVQDLSNEMNSCTCSLLCRHRLRNLEADECYQIQIDHLKTPWVQMFSNRDVTQKSFSHMAPSSVCCTDL